MSISRKTKKPNFKKIIFFFFIFLIIIELVFFFTSNHKKTSNLLSPEGYADSILQICKNAAHRPTCYDKEIPKLMDNPISFSMEDAFLTTSLIQKKDSSYTYCHLIGHRISSREVAKNPSEWQSVFTRCPILSDCSSGCIHGAFQERFRVENMPEGITDELNKELEGICIKNANWDPNPLQKGNCFHALGHMALFITAGNTKKAVEICNTSGMNQSDEDIRTCYEGIFMQLFQPSEPEDFVISKSAPDKDSLKEYCSQFTSTVKSVCWKEGWPLFKEDLNTPDKLLEFCSVPTPDLERQKCIKTLIIVLSSKFNGDKNLIANYCNDFPDSYKMTCFKTITSVLLEKSQIPSSEVIDICLSSPSPQECTDYAQEMQKLFRNK